MSIRWDSETDWKSNQDSSGTTGRNGNLRQGYSRERPDLSSDLVGYWPLHDESATDYSGNGNHGSLQDGVVSGAAGRGGLQAMDFDGGGANVALPSFGSVFDGSGDWTVNVWVRARSWVPSGNTHQLFCIRENGTAHHAVTSEGRLDLHVQDGGGTNHSVTGSTALSNDEWYMATYVFKSGGDGVLYVNGEEDARKTLNVTSTNSRGQGNQISEEPWDSSQGHHDGPLCNIRVYNRALSPSKIRMLYEWGSGDYARPPSDGVSRYSFDGDGSDNWSSNGTSISGGSFTSNSIRGQALSQTNGDQIVYQNEGEFDFSSSTPFTISAWGYFPEASGNTWVFAKDNNTPRYSAIVRGTASGSPSKIWLGLRDSSGNSIAASSPMKWDRWLHLVWRYDGSGSASGIQTYVNSVEQEMTIHSDQAIGEIQNNQNPLTLQSPGSNSSSSILDELSVYDRALNAQEIFKIYRYGTRGRDMRKQLVNH